MHSQYVFVQCISLYFNSENMDKPCVYIYKKKMAYLFLPNILDGKQFTALQLFSVQKLLFKGCLFIIMSI